jgi:hypothetical protein
MPKALTVGSSLVCAHGGTVVLKPSQSILTVDGSAVLVVGDLDGAPISGCPTPVSVAPAPVTKPCLTVVSMTSPPSAKLSVGGKPVLIDTAQGLTDGVTTPPTNQWQVKDAGQTKLDA